MRHATALCAALFVIALGGQARADLLSLRAEGRGGAAGGKGMFGERADDAFHEGIAGPAYGFLVGAEVMLVDAWIEHNQYLTSGNVDATWTQFMVGFDVQFDFGDKKSFKLNEAGKKVGGYSSWYGEMGMGAGFAVGTGQQVQPPLDNAQVTDKGFMFEIRGAAAYRIFPWLSVGVTVPVSMGYYTKSGNGAVANDIDNQYMSVGYAGLLTTRISWLIK
jgi:hypothetical protein